MTNTPACGIIRMTKPVLIVAQEKEDNMIGATEKITALYCRLSQEDERLGESLSIENHDVIYRGGFLPRKLHHDCGSFVTI